MGCKKVSAKVWNKAVGETVKINMRNWCWGRGIRGDAKKK